MFRLFTPHKFLDDESTRKSQFLFTIVCGSACIVTIILIVNCFLFPQHLLRWIITAIIFDFVSLCTLFLNAKGYTRIASLVFVGMFITVIFGLAWLGGGGINASSIQFFPIVILISGLLLGKNGGYVLGVFSILVGLGLILADYQGILPVNTIIRNAFTLWIISAMCISLFIFFQSISIASLSKALLKARQELELRTKNESRLQAISQTFISGMIYQVILEPNGGRKFTYLSNSVKELYGISPEDGLADASLIYGRVYEDDKGVVADAEAEALKSLSTFNIEVRIKDPSGGLRWSSLISTPTVNENGLIRWDGLEVIITERKKVVDALKTAEERLRFALEMSHIGAWDLDLTDHSAFRSVEHGRIFGYDELLPNWTYEMFIDHVIPEDRPMVETKFKLANETRGDLNFECRIRRVDGEVRWIWAAGRYIREGISAGRRMAGIVQDITERKEAEEHLKSSLIDKDALLQELYHRTKNNMMVISSLLELQAATTGDQETKRIVNDSVFRIRTMALAHEKLYQAKNLSRINMEEYISELAHLLMTGFCISPQKIKMHLDIEPIALLIDIAIPTGLIVNELLSNCVKYAFPGDRAGRIDISLHRVSINELELQIGDNGIGAAQTIDFNKTSTLGIQLVNRIVKNQLSGSCSVENNNGLRWRIRFRDDLYSERV